MDRDAVVRQCRALRGSVEDYPFGPDVLVFKAAGYHLNKRHWNTVQLDGSVPDEALADWIEDSYDLALAGLSAARRASLG
jgi:predicted DNA-binding protein (MmcQ/YjbR family)